MSRIIWAREEMRAGSGPRIYSRRKRAPHGPIPEGAVYVGRGTPWGNPFRVEEHGRQASISMFREYAVRRLQEEPDWLAPLRGKDLVCWCFPLACHADVLVDLANRPEGPGS